jgi:hypothetical protein
MFLARILSSPLLSTKRKDIWWIWTSGSIQWPVFFFLNLRPGISETLFCTTCDIRPRFGADSTHRKTLRKKKTQEIYVMRMLAHACIRIFFATYKHRLHTTISISIPDCNKITAFPINRFQMKATQQSNVRQGQSTGVRLSFIH